MAETLSSLQDLKGSQYFGGAYDKLKHIAQFDWDLLVIDEAHEGIDTTKTDVAFDQIKRQFPDEGKDQNVAIVDVGANVMQVAVVRNEQSVYSREQAFGGSQLTGLLPGLAGRDPAHLVQIQRLQGHLSQLQVSQMHGIEAAAHQGHVRRPVIQGHLAQGVAQHHGVGGCTLCQIGLIQAHATAPQDLKALRLQHLGHLIKTLRMARHHPRQTQIGLALQGLRPSRFLALA